MKPQRNPAQKNTEFFNSMMSSGILPPSRFEAMFLSDAHTKDDIEEIPNSFEDGLLA